jgi:hypothetical protein
MDRNFISLLRSVPLWPNDLIPLDEVLKRLASTLGPDTTSADALLALAGVLGVRGIRVQRVDGVVTVTGEVVVARELVLSPLQSYVGFVLGDAAGGTTAFPFALRLRDEPPIRNADEVFEFLDAALDPQLAAFQPVERNPATGFLDIASWRLSLRDVPARIRILKGVTRVQPIDPRHPAGGFRDLRDKFVEAGVNLSLDIDADGNVELWPRDPTLRGDADDPASLIDLDLGWFRITDSPLILGASGLGYHRANTPFPDHFQEPKGLDASWSGFIARIIGGFWHRESDDEEDEFHIYGIAFEDLLIGGDVFSVRGSFQHGAGPGDPFASTVPVKPEDLPASRWSLRRIDVWVTEGVGEHLQFGGKLIVAAILDLFKLQPIQFEVSLGRIAKRLEGFPEPLPFVELQGALAPVQNSIHPTPDGKLRLPLWGDGFWGMSFELNAVKFTVLFPGGNVPGVVVPTVVELGLDLGVEAGGGPAVALGVSGSLRYTSVIRRFEWTLNGVWLEINAKLQPLRYRGYEFNISRVAFGLGANDDYWIAFDARIEFPDALGRAEVYGMKLGWNRDADDVIFSIEGVGVAVKHRLIEFAGMLRFLDGSSSFVPEGEEPLTIQPGSLAGSVRLALPALDNPFTFEVGLTHGSYVRDNKVHAFWMLLAELIFPAGLPLGLADLGFYGVAVAVGNNVTPHKAPGTEWYDWYSMVTPKYSVVAPNKWTAAHGRFTLGLGIACGSLTRSGYPHNERLLGVLNTSSESQGRIWLFDGKVRFLKEVTATGDPQIAILLVIAPDRVLFRADFHFSFPAEGDAAAGLVMTARGMIEIVSDRTGAGRHHVHVGRNQPYSERINADVLFGFFAARAFYMLDWAELPLSAVTLPPLAMAFGFAQGWRLDKKYGPLRLYLEANVNLEVGFSFVSAVYGYLRVYGGVSLRIYGFGFGLSIDAAFTLFVSDGWELKGKLNVKLNLPWPIPDYRDTLEFDFGPGAKPPAVLPSPLRQMALSSASLDGDAPIHEWTADNQLVVPSESVPGRTELAVDGSLILAFRVPIGNRVPWISGTDARPVDGSGEWKFRYTLEDVILRRRLPGMTAAEPVPTWLEYGILEINSLAQSSSSTPTTDNAPLSQTLRIWGDAPGELLRNLGSLERSGAISWLDGFLDFHTHWPCGPDVVADPTCVHFDLVSFRVLDGSHTRVTLLPDGTPVRSRPRFAEDSLEPDGNSFVVLDEIVPNPRPDLWADHGNTLALPYRYMPTDLQWQGHLPITAAIEFNLQPSVEALVTIIGVFAAEQFVVEGFDGAVNVASATASGAGLHLLELRAPDAARGIDRIRISASNDGFRYRTGETDAVSVLASVCYHTVEQRALQGYIAEQRKSLKQLMGIFAEPPGPPGQNADHFHLHRHGTVYEVAPVVTCERKGPNASWATVHDQLHLATATVTVGPPPADLTPYLDETIPAYEQDPVYLDDDVQLRFNRSYGPEMYTVSGYDFRVEVVDAQRQPVPVEFDWTFSQEPALTPKQELLLEALHSGPCVTADITRVRRKLQLVVRPVIAPRSHYYLVLRSSAHPQANLYEAPFTTSHYRSFADQYADLGKHLFHELLPRAADAVLLSAALSSLPLAKREEEHALHERVWEEALGLTFRPRPEHGEVIVLYEPAGAPRALLIDSPEPLLVDRRTQLTVTAPTGAAIAALRSLDGSRTLLFAHGDGDVTELPAGDYVLETTYLRGVAGLPTQRVAGDSSPTTASITIAVTSEALVAVEAL